MQQAERRRERESEGDGASESSHRLSYRHYANLRRNLQRALTPGYLLLAACLPAVAAVAAAAAALPDSAAALLRFPVAHSITRISINCHLGTAIFHTT